MRMLCHRQGGRQIAVGWVCGVWCVVCGTLRSACACPETDGWYASGSIAGGILPLRCPLRKDKWVVHRRGPLLVVLGQPNRVCPTVQSLALRQCCFQHDWQPSSLGTRHGTSMLDGAHNRARVTGVRGASVGRGSTDTGPALVRGVAPPNSQPEPAGAAVRTNDTTGQLPARWLAGSGGNACSTGCERAAPLGVSDLSCQGSEVLLVRQAVVRAPTGLRVVVVDHSTI